MKHTGTILVTAILLSAESALAEVPRSPVAVALLQGAELARTRFDQLRVSFTEEIQFSGTDKPLVRECLIEMSGPNRRFELLRDPNDQAHVISIIRGQEAYRIRRKPHADLSIYDLKDALDRRGDMGFDPRVLGLTDWIASDKNCRAYLWYDSDTSLTVEGTEVIRGAKVSRIKATYGETTSTYWIEEPSFRVHRRTVESASISDLVDSMFSPDDSKSPFPTRVEGERISRMQGGNSWKVVWTVSSIDFTTPISPDRFTIESMDLPVGTVLNDYRTHRIVGFWDGEKVAKEPIATLPETTQPREGSSLGRFGYWLIALANVLLVCCAVGFARRRLTIETKA